MSTSLFGEVHFKKHKPFYKIVNKTLNIKCAIIGLNLACFCCLVNAQTQTTILKTYPKDSVIKAEIIDPFQKASAEKGNEPNWQELQLQIALKYDSVFADRLTNKAQIYYYYGKEWPAFTAALVRYTEKYENHEDIVLLDYNAKMILQFSADIKELETALAWSKRTTDKDPGNKNYKQTYEELKSKIGIN